MITLQMKYVKQFYGVRNWKTIKFSLAYEI